ncbi:inorganic phosphate transporter 2-1, chloroplastic-like isoform X1 [Phragmites australis]|uniref:inorganic phosphate transporter 2-1, chloroplastic-like isoform X1 n=1 Tax=Phragmites australis TaxID=29695 RepID=UPI002D78272E|nr:inorganic phosphate transporter 2-1, chloroplastic-like isoform X1 [Phragmites australis]
MSQSSPFFSIARVHTGAAGQAAAVTLLLRHPVAQLPLSIHGPRYFCLAKASPAKTLSLQLGLPRATLSSFAGADDGSSAKANAAEAEEQNGECELSEMAKAFNISPRMAMSISVMIAFVALTMPLVMRSLVCHGTFKMSALAYLTLLSGFYMAWNIGANDVANAMGTSVGSGALTLRQAVLTAAVLEFSGAFLMGTHVTSTMQKGILVTSVFQGKDSLLFAGLLSSLAAAGTWLQVMGHQPFEPCYIVPVRSCSLVVPVASSYGWPVSTTHCIVGAMVGFGLVFGGVNAVFWSSLARVSSSWVISPLMGAAVSFLVYKCIRRFVYSAPNPGQAAAAAAPIAVFTGITAISFAALPLSKIFSIALLQAVSYGAIGAIIVSRVIQNQLGGLLSSEAEKIASAGKTNAQQVGFLSDVAGPTGAQLQIVYGVFGYMQVLSACFMSFAHGGNDVSNAIGPLAAALSILQGMASSAEIVIPTEVLVWGGFGIVAGLTMWGYRVIATIGKKITELTPTRGFAAEFAAASVVLFASKLGLPISATHTLVGAVMGVGFARGLNRVRAETVREIVASWLVTIPVGAMLSIFYTLILTRILGYFM